MAGKREPGGGVPRAARAGLAGLAAVTLLALAAAGSQRGSLGRGGGHARFPLELVETLVLLLAVAGLAALVLAAWVLLPDQRLRTPRRRRGGGAYSLLMVLLVVLVVWVFRGQHQWFGRRQGPPTTTPPPGAGPDATAPPLMTTRYAWVPVLLVGLLVVALGAVLVAQAAAERRRRSGRSPRQRLAELVDDTLDDVLREPDPRRAVIAAWARMERGLAAAGLPRRAAEAPFEYLGRVLAEQRVRPAAAHRLTDLFERAKFSRHPVDRGMRDDAVAALLAVRQELLEQEQEEREEREEREEAMGR
ncbi:MAG TPA: DUF4129 domain-containing protein [Actinomycetes bacterium]|nr:DUF4129 domain-containing protein [Actinomycetes bacterium]